jgi:hypothetical protein
MVNVYTVRDNSIKKIGKLDKRRIVIKKTNDTFLSMKECKEIVRQLANKYENQKGREPKMYVRGLSITQVITLKGLADSIDDMYESYEDYLRGRPRNDTKFMKMSQLEIIMY